MAGNQNQERALVFGPSTADLDETYLNNLYKTDNTINSNKGKVTTDGISGAVENAGMKAAHNLGISRETVSSVRQSASELKMLFTASPDTIAAYYGENYDTYVANNKSVVNNYYDTYDQKDEDKAKEKEASKGSSLADRFNEVIKNGLSNIVNKSPTQAETADDYSIE